MVLGEEGDKSDHTGLDFALAYLVWCHSLIEWVHHDEKVEKQVLGRMLKDQFGDWEIVRDVANRCRHLDLTHSPSDKNWSANRSWYGWETAAGGEVNGRWVLFHKDKMWELSNLVFMAHEAWETVLSELGLNPSINFDQFGQPAC